MPTSKCLSLVLAAVLPACLAGAAQAQTRAETSDLDRYPLDRVQLAGSHNTYDKKDVYEYLSDALRDVQMIEVDAWTNLGSWRVSHSNPLANINNCPKGGQPGNDRNQDLRSCLDTIASYHRNTPGHPLVLVKLEMKNGFGTNTQPADLDEMIANLSENGLRARIPESDIFTPLKLMCRDSACGSRYATPAEALANKPWPTLGELRGKVMFLIVPGTVSDSGPRDYATALASGKARLAFPMLIVKDTTTDPTAGYYGGNAGWNVAYDVQAGRLDSGAIPRSLVQSWTGRRFLLSVNDDKPGGDGADVATGRARLHQLARDYHANLVNTDQEHTGIPASFAIP